MVSDFQSNNGPHTAECVACLKRLGLVRIGGMFRLKMQIGSGSFGVVYLGVNIMSNDEVAIKLESLKVQNHQLEHEYEVYKSIACGPGIPHIQWFGTEGNYNTMVLQRLGPSLEDLFQCCNHKFTLKTVLLLADQLLTRIEYLHSRNFIHRDVKPANFLMGIGEHANIVYLVDFGLAMQYRDARTRAHIPSKVNCILTGTAPYASIRNHHGFQQSRRDDLESLAYLFLYFLHGSLPWYSHLQVANRVLQSGKILQAKIKLQDVLFAGSPNEFTVFLKYARGLRFDAKPDYAYLRKLFRDLFLREGYQYDGQFDWCTKDGSSSGVDIAVTTSRSSNPLLFLLPRGASESHCNHMT